MRQVTFGVSTQQAELSVLEEFIDLETGVIRELLRPGVGFEDPDWFLRIAMPSRIWNTGLFPGKHNLSEGNVVGESDLSATLGAIGETLERYCLAFYDRRELVLSSYAQASSHGLTNLTDPRSYALFAPEQEVSWCVPFTRESPVYWTRGISLCNKHPAWLPAQFVYLPYTPSVDEDYVFTSSSTGAAFGSTLENAILSGLCETVERDAFAIYWLNKLELPALDVLADAELARWYAKLFGKYDNQLNVYDITTDLGIPCFFALLRGDPQRAEPFVSVGAACHPDPVRALKKTILEAFHTRRYGMNLMLLEGAAEPAYASSAETNRFHAHVLRYTRPLPDSEIRFCYAPARSEPLAHALERHGAWSACSDSARLRACVDRLRACGYDAITVDVTTDDVAEKGFHAMKTVVPGLHPLWAGEDVPLGGSRIYDVPPLLGMQRKHREQMNLFPHPFP